MFSKPSLMTRIVIGKTVGFIIGLTGFFMLPSLFWRNEPDDSLGFCFLVHNNGRFYRCVWCTHMAPDTQVANALVVSVIVDRCWLNFVLTLFIYDLMQGYMTSYFGENGLISSPFWFVFEGALVGLLMGYLTTRFGGEGKETVGR